MKEYIEDILEFIEENLYENINLSDIANQFGYSKYYFSRNFKSAIGESVNSYILRLRIERSIFKLMDNSSITDIAFNLGYNTTSGFNKAFKKKFGVSPTIFFRQKLEMLQEYSDTLQNTPTLETFDDLYFTYKRNYGNYKDSTVNVWKKIKNDIRLNKYFTQKDKKLFGFYYDDPAITSRSLIRYDGAVEITKEDYNKLKKTGQKVRFREKCNYITVIHTGGTTNLANSWYGLYYWINKHNYKVNNKEPFEIYQFEDDTFNICSKSLSIKICIPIK